MLQWTNFKLRWESNSFVSTSKDKKAKSFKRVKYLCIFRKIFFSDISNYIYFRTDFGPFDHILSYNGINPINSSPLNLTIFKGLKNVALTQNFSDMILHNPIAIELYNSLCDMYISDESFYNTFATLDFMSNGSFVQNLHKDLSHGIGSKRRV